MLGLTENRAEWTDIEGQSFELDIGTENTTAFCSHGPGYDHLNVEILISNGDMEKLLEHALKIVRSRK